MQTIEYFYIYQNKQGGIELKGSIATMKKPITLTYHQLQDMQYPFYSLPNFDARKFYNFYFRVLHQHVKAEVSLAHT